MSHPKNMDGSRFIWTKELCLSAAIQHPTVYHLKRNNDAAYTAAKARGWRKEITSHMVLFHIWLKRNKVGPPKPSKRQKAAAFKRMFIGPTKPRGKNKLKPGRVCNACGERKKWSAFAIKRKPSGEYRRGTCKLCKRKSFHKRHPHVRSALHSKRRARKQQATPPWYESRPVTALHKLRNDLRDIGIESDIDHIVPLNHPLVCGLHCRANLQLLSPDENSDKSNKFDPDTHIHVL